MARAAHTRPTGAALGLCLALAACSDPELATAPRPDSAVPRRLVGVPVVIDAGTLVVQGRTVALWGIDAPARDARCTRADGTSWPCGEHAASALAGWIGARGVNCDPRGRAGDDPVVALCRLNGRDVGKWLVMHGWARDAPARSGRLYQTLERAAASRQRGLHGDGPPPAAPRRRTRAIGDA